MTATARLFEIEPDDTIRSAGAMRRYVEIDAAGGSVFIETGITTDPAASHCYMLDRTTFLEAIMSTFGLVDPLEQALLMPVRQP